MPVLRPLQDFLRTEAASGVLLLVMVPIALFWANGPFAGSYEALWGTEFSVALAGRELSLDLRHWVNEGLMALFFFVVGLEIKRELIDGDLKNRRNALTPVMAALGGMLLPAAIYLAFNAGGTGSVGWGIPMATDIAIVLGILVLVGDRVPTGLKTFLLTLAIVDDLGAILVIAVFYSGHSLDLAAMGGAIALFGAVYGARRLGISQPALYVVLALAAWLATYAAGIHATLAGVVLAILTPGRPIRGSDYVDAEALADVSTYEAASETATIARESVSSVEWLQHVFHPWSSYLVLPLFALANAGIVVSRDSLIEAIGSPVTFGVAAGLLLGKPLGICLFSWIAVRFCGGLMPGGVRFAQVAAGSVLAGIGFTVSLFIADLAFVGEDLVAEAKAGVLAASFVSGIAGFGLLRLALRFHARPPLASRSTPA